MGYGTATQAWVILLASMVVLTDPMPGWAAAPADAALAAAAAQEEVAGRHPGQPALKLDLATLYLAAGQAGPARTVLLAMLAAPDLPELLRHRAEGLLVRAEAVERGLSYSGTITLAGRYDSNASPVPAGTVPSPRLTGRTEDLEDEFIGRSDYAGVAMGSLQGLWGLTPGTTVELNVLGYGSRRISEDEVNLNLLAADAGPRFQLDSGLGEWSVRPFLSAAYLELEDTDYLRSLGVGLNFQAYVGASVLADATAELLRRDFRDTASRPDAEQRSGWLWVVQGGVRWQVSPSTLVFGHTALIDNNAERDAQSYRRAAVSLGVSQTHPAPLGLTPRSWTTSLALGLSRTVYDAPDPRLDPGARRNDARQDLMLTTRVPLSDDVALVLTGLRSWVRSTVDGFDHTNTAATVGIAWRF